MTVEKIAQDTVATLKIDIYDLQGNLLEQTPADGVRVLIGHEDIFPTVEKALLGKKVGEELEIILEPEDAFGEFDETLIREIPTSAVGDNVEEGMKIEGVPGEANDGRIYTVIYSGEDKTILDGNHELAGTGLKLFVKVLDIQKPTEEEIDQMESSELMPDLFEVSDVDRSQIH